MKEKDLSFCMLSIVSHSWSQKSHVEILHQLKKFVFTKFYTIYIWSRVAQWKRAGPITQRSVDRNYALLIFFANWRQEHQASNNGIFILSYFVRKKKTLQFLLFINFRGKSKPRKGFVVDFSMFRKSGFFPQNLIFF